MAHDGFPNPWLKSTQARCSVEADSFIVKRAYLYNSAWDLRRRTGMTGDHPQIGTHTGRESVLMHTECHSQAGKVARDMDTLGRVYPPSTSNWALDWVGQAGALHCKDGWHRHGLAIDLTRFNFSSSGRFVDMNRHWRDSRIRLRRRYLAVVAMCRKHFGVVLHGHNDPDTTHVNHIHVDRSRHAVSLNTNNETDTTIVQWAARDVAGMTMAIDGSWGPQTQNGYQTLMSRFKMTRAYGGCFDFDPLSTTSHQRIFMDMIGRHAFANQSAGAYTMATPPCPT